MSRSDWQHIHNIGEEYEVDPFPHDGELLPLFAPWSVIVESPFSAGPVITSSSIAIPSELDNVSGKMKGSVNVRRYSLVPGSVGSVGGPH